MQTKLKLQAVILLSMGAFTGLAASLVNKPTQLVLVCVAAQMWILAFMTASSSSNRAMKF